MADEDDDVIDITSDYYRRKNSKELSEVANPHFSSQASLFATSTQPAQPAPPPVCRHDLDSRTGEMDAEEIIDCFGLNPLFEYFGRSL